MVNKEVFQAVYDSFCRCAASKGFYDDFYESFLGSSEEVRQKFSKTDMAKQKRALDKSLALMVMFANGNSIARQGLERVADLHNSRQHNIHPRLYDQWLECLMQTVRKHDARVGLDLDKQWREVLAVGIDYFRHRYFFGTPYFNLSVGSEGPEA